MRRKQDAHIVNVSIISISISIVQYNYIRLARLLFRV